MFYVSSNHPKKSSHCRRYLEQQSLNKQKDSGDSIKFVIPQPVKLAHDFYKRQGFYDEQTSIDDDAMSEYECETAEQFISVYDYEDIPRNNYGKIAGSMS